VKPITCMHEWMVNDQWWMMNIGHGEVVNYWTVYCDWCHTKSCNHHVQLFPVLYDFILGDCGILAMETLSWIFGLMLPMRWPLFWRSRVPHLKKLIKDRTTQPNWYWMQKLLLFTCLSNFAMCANLSRCYTNWGN
jgi:hypothetical protein